MTGKLICVLTAALCALSLMVACEGEKNEAEGGEEKATAGTEGTEGTTDPVAPAGEDEAAAGTEGDGAAEPQAAAEPEAPAEPAVDLSGLMPTRGEDNAWYYADESGAAKVTLERLGELGTVTHARSFVGNRAWVQVFSDANQIAGWVMVDETGAPVLEGVTIQSVMRKQGVDGVYCVTSHGGTKDTADDGKGVLSAQGEWLVEPTWATLKCPTDEKVPFIYVQNADKKHGLLGLDGSEVLAAEYDSIRAVDPMNPELPLNVQKGDTWGVFFPASKKRVEATQDSCVVKDGQASCTTGDATTTWDASGNPIGG